MAHLIRPLRQWPRMHLNGCCHPVVINNFLLSSSQTSTNQLTANPLLYSHPFSVPSSNRKLHFQSRGLKLPNVPLPPPDYKEAESSDSDGDGRPSRNKRKREARRAVRWGMDLASFSTPQIKRIARVASLEQEVFDALMTVKKLGRDVREGKRRQYNYIGKLLRDVEPELMDALIQATKDGDHSRFEGLVGSGTNIMEDEDTEDEQPECDEEDEDSDECIEIATRWYDGLVNKDVAITNEVYSINTVDFDRQELRKLVRGVQKIEEREAATVEGKVDPAVTRAKNSLKRFLCDLAKQM